MDLTVCVCTYNRPRYVADCLEGLSLQTVPRVRFGILLVDSASTGGVPARLAELAAAHDARLIRVNQPGVSAARNAGAWAARSAYIAYIDDDAIPATDWVEQILAALDEADRPTGVIGGRILPKWEAPLPAWWPPSLRGLLSIIEHEGRGEYRSPALPAGLEPYAANMTVHVLSLIAAGGFGTALGRHAGALLSDEDVQLAWTLQEQGLSVRYDSRIVVHHQIQATRLNPQWLLARLYWQGASTVLTRRTLRRANAVWRELPRRLAVAALCAPVGLIPGRSSWLMAPRWRLAYARGFVRAAFGWRADLAARQQTAPAFVAAVDPA